jgi:hypothetical protein
MKSIIFLLLTLFLFSCDYYPYGLSSPYPTADISVDPEPTPASFEQVSQPYIDLYGQPEEIESYNSDCYHTVDWWYWSIGFEVSFIDTCYDEVIGWRVNSEYHF